MMGLFEKKKTPTEKLREMKSIIRKEQRALDRDIYTLQRKGKETEIEIKKYAKSNNIQAAKIIAKELVNSRRSVSRLYAAKAHMNSVIMDLDHQYAVVRMAGSVKKSTEVMSAMSKLVKLPEIQRTMQELSKEMTKMGIIDEMVQDTMESALGDSEEIEDAASSEVDKILWEITAGQMGKAPAAVEDSLPAGVPVAGASATSSRTKPSAEAAGLPSDLDENEDEEELSVLRAQLNALRS